MKESRFRNRVMDIAYIRDGELLHTDESVILACLLHARGNGRDGQDMTEVRKLMHDKNLVSSNKRKR